MLPRVDWGHVAVEDSEPDEGLPLTPRGVMLIPSSDQRHDEAWEEHEEVLPRRFRPLRKLPKKQRRLEEAETCRRTWVDLRRG